MIPGWPECSCSASQAMIDDFAHISRTCFGGHLLFLQIHGTTIIFVPCGRKLHVEGPANSESSSQAISYSRTDGTLATIQPILNFARIFFWTFASLDLYVRDMLY